MVSLQHALQISHIFIRQGGVALKINRFPWGTLVKCSVLKHGGSDKGMCVKGKTLTHPTGNAKRHLARGRIVETHS
jgi:hypothetical protein